MARPQTDKRQRLTETAADLAYRRGFAGTTLADIAHQADVPLGTVYYYFKTKSEIAEAIAAQRLVQCDLMCAMWDQAGGPRERLVAYVQQALDRLDDLIRSGCPMGSFCTELRKIDEATAGAAARPFERLLGWMEAQFGALGRDEEKRALAVHLVCGVQGAIVLGNSLGDPSVVRMQGERLIAWIRTL
jgi:AcrR family transcriptional regulator